MDFLGAAAVAIAAGVLIVLSPRESWGLALKTAGVFAAVTIVLALLLPPSRPPSTGRAASCAPTCPAPRALSRTSWGSWSAAGASP